MSFPLFTKQKQNKTYVLLVDVGSASVGTAIAVVENGRAPLIIASCRENILFQEALSSARFLSAMNQALGKALKKLSGMNAGITPAYAYCTLSSPWFILKVRNLDVSREKEFDVTEQSLDGFINDDIATLKEELKETLPPKDVRIIEKKILSMKLNGYEVKNPYKQRTARIELSAVIGVSSGKVIQSIEHKIGSFFHVAAVHFGAFPVAAFSAVRDMFPTERNFLFLDITGESTDVSLVENDLLTHSVSFSRGKNFFIREISARMRTVHEDAATLFSMFLRNELHDKEYERVKGIISQAEREWIVRFEKTLGTLVGKGIVPRKIFFTADADITNFFSELFSKVKIDQLMGASFDVQYLDQLIVSKFVSFGGGVTRDPFIVIEALLVEKLFKQHN